MSVEPAPPPPRRLIRRLFRAAGPRDDAGGRTLGEVIAGLGDRSFGWLILIFALANMIPLPPGSSLVLGLPLLIITAQMALGLRQVWLPGFVTRRRVDRKAFQRVVLRFGPLIRRVERLARPRHQWLFAPGPERALGLFLLCLAFALFVPIPFSAYGEAAALFVIGFGLAERDGLVALAGVGLGVVAIIVSVIWATLIYMGAVAVSG